MLICGVHVTASCIALPNNAASAIVSLEHLAILIERLSCVTLTIKFRPPCYSADRLSGHSRPCPARFRFILEILSAFFVTSSSSSFVVKRAPLRIRSASTPN